MNDRLKRMHATVERCLNDLRRQFVDEMELTFIARLPGNPDADVLITNDNLDELGWLVDRCKARDV